VSMTLSSLLADYRQGKRTPSEVIESLRPAQDDAYACAWICRVGPDALGRRARQLEQMVREDSQALSRLPLYGIPFAVKDNIDVAGLPTTAACPAFSRVPERSATAVEKLEAAGAILVGKTNVAMLLGDYQTSNPVFGRSNNPWDLERTPGGCPTHSARNTSPADRVPGRQSRSRAARSVFPSAPTLPARAACRRG